MAKLRRRYPCALGGHGETMLLLDCSAISQTTLLIRRETGVVYEYETPDANSERMRCEGCLIPLAEVTLDGGRDAFQTRIDEFVDTMGDFALDKDQALQIEHILNEAGIPVKVDWSRFDENRVAWLPVLIVDSCWAWPKLEEGEGILIW